MRLLAVAALAFVGTASPAEAARPSDERHPGCVRPKAAHGHDVSARRGVGWHGRDHHGLGVHRQHRIAVRTERILARRPVATHGRARMAAGTIPVYVHVMADQDGTGNVGAGRITDQVDVLNAAFAGADSPGVAADTGIRFALADIDRYTDNAFHKDRESTAYRARTHRGGARALNVWLVGFNDLGAATFPWDYDRNPRVDGVRVHFESLPGGSFRRFDQGKTLVHETGHWLGLYHTFQGGCSELNDEVVDTPSQSIATEGCPVGQDSCGQPGLDPVHNYMDYSRDDCYSEFTPGQALRMQQMAAAYRA